MEGEEGLLPENILETDNGNVIMTAQAAPRVRKDRPAKSCKKLPLNKKQIKADQKTSSMSYQNILFSGFFEGEPICTR
jgi:hypothetical protein